ncbi:MAG: hypothetical protein FWB94_00065 [Chitinispirillia bacterium]|nr:hypothetical protein [Chitinispirillia bacterium]
MIWTALLWAILAAAALLLIIIAAPIRFGGALAFRKEEREEPEYEFWVTYLHPIIFKYEYASAGARQRMVILGFEKKDKGVDAGANDKEEEDASVNTGRKSINTGDNTPVNADNNTINTDDNAINANGDKSVNTDNNGIDTDDDPAVNTKNNINNDDDPPTSPDNGSINTNDNDAQVNTDKNKSANTRKSANNEKRSEHRSYKGMPKDSSLVSKIKKRVNRVKKNKIYKLATDKPLRKKVYRWLRRLLACTFKILLFDHLRLRVRAGYPDPAALGKAYGYFIAAREALQLRSASVDLSMEPVFTENCLNIDARAAGRTTLSIIFWHITVVVLTFPYWRAYRVIRKKKS